jgi:hypothetical protein
MVHRSGWFGVAIHEIGGTLARAVWRQFDSFSGAGPETAMCLQMIAGFGNWRGFRRLRRRSGNFAVARRQCPELKRASRFPSAALFSCTQNSR